MRRGNGLLISVFLFACFAIPARAQQSIPSERPWWVEFQLGEGQLQLASDQFPGARSSTFAMGFAGGHRLGSRARIGLLLNGWLLQAFDLNNPTVGESVSNVMAVADVFPIPTVPLFLRGGTGAAFYENARPEGNNGSGWAWMAGAGYEFRLGGRFGLAPIVDYSAGTFGDVRNPITVETGRRYSVVEFKIGVFWHFGKSE
ncbi:MAG: porin family protein [Acidobacteria bacterium]|nr:porin family protein [Acidobacteriota bacterium]